MKSGRSRSGLDLMSAGSSRGRASCNQPPAQASDANFQKRYSVSIIAVYNGVKAGTVVNHLANAVRDGQGTPADARRLPQNVADLLAVYADESGR